MKFASSGYWPKLMASKRCGRLHISQTIEVSLSDTKRTLRGQWTWIYLIEFVIDFPLITFSETDLFGTKLCLLGDTSAAKILLLSAWRMTMSMEPKWAALLDCSRLRWVPSSSPNNL